MAPVIDLCARRERGRKIRGTDKNVTWGGRWFRGTYPEPAQGRSRPHRWSDEIAEAVTQGLVGTFECPADGFRRLRERYKLRAGVNVFILGGFGDIPRAGSAA